MAESAAGRSSIDEAAADETEVVNAAEKPSSRRGAPLRTTLIKITIPPTKTTKPQKRSKVARVHEQERQYRHQHQRQPTRTRNARRHRTRRTPIPLHMRGMRVDNMAGPPQCTVEPSKLWPVIGRAKATARES